MPDLRYHGVQAGTDTDRKRMTLEKGLDLLSTEIEMNGPLLARVDCEIIRIWGVYWNGQHKLLIWRGQEGTTVASHPPGAKLELL